MSACPYCSRPLLRHICGKQVYWFCRNCWQKVPDLEFNSKAESKIVAKSPDEVSIP